MVTKWTSVKSVLFELERFIPKEFYNEGRLIEDCMRAVDRIGAVTSYQQRVKFIEVSNYKACIPADCLQIIQVAMKNRMTTDTDIMSLAETAHTCGDGCTTCTDTQLFDINNIVSQTVVPSKNFYNYWTALRLSTNSFAQSVHCDNCVNFTSTCQYEYSVAPTGDMTFSFQDGFICISYYCYPMDCDNIPLIPDDEDYKQALINFCLMTAWELRWNMKEDGADSRYIKYQQLWGLFKAKATASIRMPDVGNAENLMQISLTLIPNTRRFNSFFSNLASPENLRMGGKQYWYR